jgi:hypothetical protein
MIRVLGEKGAVGDARTHFDFGKRWMGRNSTSLLGIQGNMDRRADSGHLGKRLVISL